MHVFFPRLSWSGAGAASALLAAIALAPLSAQAQGGPAYGTDQNYCDRGAMSRVLSTSPSNLLGSAAGGIVGGLLGSNIGRGSGNTLATIAGVVGGALAGGYVGRSMAPEDQACVHQTLEHAPPNRTVAWQNPDNGSSYWVTPTRSYQGPNGEPCRAYITQAVVNGAPQRSDSEACREPNGAWRPVSANMAAPTAPAGPDNGALSTGTILKVQQRLRQLGFYGQVIDGAWGPQTSRALGNFQRANNLRPTGQIDVETLGALGLAGTGGQPEAPPPGQAPAASR